MRVLDLALEQLPKLIFGENVGTTFSNVDEFYAFVRHANPAVLKANFPKASFPIKGSIVTFPNLKISTSASGPCIITTQFTSKRFSLIVPLAGYGTIGTRQHPLEWNTQDNLIFNALSEDNTFTFEDVRSQVLFEIDVSRLTQTFASMYGVDANRSVISADRTSIETVGEKTKHTRSLLLSTLSLIDVIGHDEEYLTRIGFDDVILRIIAEMTLEGRAPSLAIREYKTVKRSQRAVRLICDLITQAKGSPLTSTQMETASGMTSRALNYAFREAYDCSPQEWQRNYFLDEAHAEMLRGDKISSLKEIAYDYGFSTPQSFTTFYHRRFGERPSETLSKIVPKSAIKKSIKEDEPQ